MNETLTHILQVEQILIPLISGVFVVLSVLGSGAAWILSLRGRILECENEIKRLHNRDDSAKERDADLCRSMDELKKEVGNLSTNVAVLTDRLERRE